MVNLPPKGDEFRREGYFFSTLKATAQPVPAMNVQVSAGGFWLNSKKYIECSGGKSPEVTAPPTGAKWCLLYVNQHGYLRIEDGTSSSRPVPPDCPRNCFPLSLIYVTSADTAITVDKIFDVRAVFATGNTSHAALDDNDSPNSHPIEAITGLNEALQNIPTLSDFESALQEKCDLDGTPSETFTLNKDQVGPPASTVQMIVERGTEPNVSIRWNEVSRKWEYTNDGQLYTPLDVVTFSPATRDEIGGVIVGNRLSVDSGGILSADLQTENNYSALDKSKVEQIPSNLTQLLNNKVDKEFGKQLTTEDYTSAEKAKVTNVPADTNSALSNKVDKIVGKGLSTNDYTTDDKNKVSNLPTNTITELSNKASVADVEARFNQLVGTAPETLDTVQELAAALQGDANVIVSLSTQIDSKVDKVAGKTLSTNDYTDTDKAKVDAFPADVQASLDAKVDIVTGMGLSTNDYTDVDKAKVTNVPADTNNALSMKVDKDGTKVLSDVNYTQVEKDKVALVPADIDVVLAAKADITYVDNTVDARVNEIIGTAPAALDTLQELATALGDDADFATTITNQLANKVDVDGTKVLSDVNYTQVEKDKVLNIPADTNAELALKVDKVAGKGLSEADYTTIEKNKVANIPSDTITELSNKVTVEAGKGLSTNDYTNADKAKVDLLPADIDVVLSAKADTTYVDNQLASLVDTAPEALDTLNELATALGNDPDFATTIATSLGNKVDKVAGKGLSTNDYTTEDQTKVANVPVDTNAALALKVDVDGTKVLSDTNYTQSEKDKLALIPSDTQAQIDAKQDSAWVSGELTGTGSEETISHTLGRTPTAVFVSPTDTTAASGTGFVITEGVHDASNIMLSVTAGVKFKIMTF